jgi:uncharacterized integral membrane protein
MSSIHKFIDFCFKDYPLVFGVVLSAIGGALIVLILYKMYPIKKK